MKVTQALETLVESTEPGPAAAEPAPSHAPPLRPVAEFLVTLLIGILFARSFVAEAYIVPTGSMAPTLLGLHREYVCPSCTQRFDLGMDESGRSGRPVCPNCGEGNLLREAAVECSGDRLLV